MAVCSESKWLSTSRGHEKLIKVERTWQNLRQLVWLITCDGIRRIKRVKVLTGVLASKCSPSPTQLICIWILFVNRQRKKDIAGFAPDPPTGGYYHHLNFTLWFIDPDRVWWIILTFFFFSSEESGHFILWYYCLMTLKLISTFFAPVGT